MLLTKNANIFTNTMVINL